MAVTIIMSCRHGAARRILIRSSRAGISWRAENKGSEEVKNMADESQGATPASWKTAQVYIMALVCLLLGLALGYLFRGSRARSLTMSAPAAAPQASTSPAGHPMPTLDQMKQMADTKAEPLLSQLKSDPNNAGLLIQVGKIYQSTHQFKEAAIYFGKSLQVNPKDVATRTEMASCLYYDGDVDGAIAQLQQTLQDDPKDANALFNLGMIKWKGKNDANGAIATWRQLLKSNPHLENAKKAQVQKLMAEANQPGTTN
jgi:cytochrome c-type biogenesis protein CcmH/NrfG